MRIQVFILALLAVGSMASGGNHITHLTGSDFSEKVADGKVYFVKFFAPWCGHCKKLAPTWEELGSSVAGDADVVIASVDCTQHQTVCQAAEIKGYPTLKVYHNGNAVETYSGARALDDLTGFVLRQRKLLLEETTA